MRAVDGAAMEPPLPRSWFLLMVSGVTLALAGMVWAGSTVFLIDHEASGSERCDRNLYENMLWSGRILGRAGLLLLVLGMIGAGAATQGMDKVVRAALFLGASALVAIGMPGSTLFFVAPSC